MRRSSPSTARNRGPLLDALRSVLAPPAFPVGGTVLELASGSGEHGVFFAEHLPDLVWQPSDPEPGARSSASAWIAHTGLGNVRPPLDLDVLGPWPAGPFHAVVAINLIHISPWEATEALFAGAAPLLGPGAPLVTYGPYRVGGAHTAPSNEAFDADLRARDPRWGVRDLEAVVDAASRRGFALEQRVPMPANNFTLVFRRAGPPR